MGGFRNVYCSCIWDDDDDFSGGRDLEGGKDEGGVVRDPFPPFLFCFFSSLKLFEEPPQPVCCVYFPPPRVMSSCLYFYHAFCGQKKDFFPSGNRFMVFFFFGRMVQFYPIMLRVTSPGVVSE